MYRIESPRHGACVFQNAQTFSIAALVLGIALSGCGGGGGNGGSSSGASPTPTPSTGASPPPAAETISPHFTIQWAARSRALNPPASALSVVVTLSGAGAGGSPSVFTLDRDLTQVGAYSQTYTWPTAIREATYPLSIVFYAQADGAGAAVATATTTATIDASATLPNVTLQQAITQVVVASGQTVAVGQTTDLAVTAYASPNSIVPVTPGSIFFAIQSGSTLLANVGGGATVQGLKPGTASVSATIDGVASAAASVSITSNATVAITPTDPPTLSLGGTAAFTAAVTNAPDTSVTWSVLEGSSGGGTITSAGVYTAPGTAGTYHIVATSNYDPTKSASVPVTVANGSVTVGANFPPSGSVSGSVN